MNGYNSSNNNTAETENKECLINIRQLTIDDLAAVFHLGERVFTAETSQNLYRTWDEYEVTTLFQEDSGFCQVAETETTVVGFILGTTINKRNSSWRYGYLIWLAVDPEYQKQGVAEKLFKQFRTLMIEEGVRILLVDTEASNHGALRFFKKMGFEKPKKHIYLTLNFDTERKSLKK